MGKQLKLLNASIDNERHVYLWKPLSSFWMIYIWLFAGLMWIVFLHDLFDKRINWLDILFWGVNLASICSLLYATVLKVSVEISSNKFLISSTPFNFRRKNINMEDIKQVIVENPNFGETYNIKVELKSNESVKLIEGLNQEEAIELTKLFDSSVKHFQHAQLASKPNLVSLKFE